MILSNWQRDRETAYLRVLGLAQSQANAILMLEQLPGVLTAGVVGAALGIAIQWLVAPGLDLGSYVGIQSVPVVINGLAFLAVVGGMIAAMIAAHSLRRCRHSPHPPGPIAQLGER